jgi:Fusaric acid resistance protein-like
MNEPVPSSSRLAMFVAKAFRFNLSAIDWWFALRAGLGVAIALTCGLRFGSALDALAAGMGAVYIAPTSLQGIHRTRAMTMIVASFGMAFGASIASWAGQSTLAIILVTAGFAYFVGILSSLGSAANAAGMNALVATIILGNIGTPTSRIGEVALWVLAGGLIQTALVMLSWPVGGCVTERRALATAYRKLASYARMLPTQRVSFPPYDPLLRVRAVLDDPQPFGRRNELLSLQTLADQAERILETLGSIVAAKDGVIPGLPNVTAELLDAIAAALDTGKPPEDAGVWERAQRLLPHDQSWQRLYGQIRSAWRVISLPGLTVVAESLVGGPVAAPNTRTPYLERWTTIVRENVGLSSSFGRHAIRFAVVAAVSIVIFRVGHLPRGYWVALTALMVLRPDFTTTASRGVERVAGTLAGSVVAWCIGRLVPDVPINAAAVAVAAAAFGFIVFPVNWALYSLAITCYVIFMLSMAGFGEKGALVDRIVATLAGGALATLAYWVWPTAQTPLTRAQLAKLIELLRISSQQLLSIYAGDSPIGARSLGSGQNAIWPLRTQIDASVERMLGEPGGAGDLTRDRALKIVASTQRFGLANVALRSEVLAKAPEPVPAIRPFAGDLDASMRAIERALQDGKPITSTPNLRMAYLTLTHALQTANARETHVLLTECDLYVDSLNVIAETLAGRP